MTAAMPVWTVIGCYAENSQRYREVFRAETARGAEDAATLAVREEGGTLWVARVFAGDHESRDKYTAYVKRDDERNQELDYLEPDDPGVPGQDPEWTVVGIAIPPDTPADEVYRFGERYVDHVNANSPGAAEDVAESRLADKHGELWVCGVLAGALPAADGYATFVDPEVKPA